MICNIKLAKLEGDRWLVEFVEVQGHSPVLNIEVMSTQELMGWIVAISAVV